MLATNPADWLAGDCIDLLAECKKPYLFTATLKEILFKELANTSRPSRVIESCVNGFATLGFFAKANIARVISLVPDKNDFNVRKALLIYINKAEHLDCIVTSYWKVSPYMNMASVPSLSTWPMKT